MLGVEMSVFGDCNDEKSSNGVSPGGLNNFDGSRAGDDGKLVFRVDATNAAARGCEIKLRKLFERPFGSELPRVYVGGK